MRNGHVRNAAHDLQLAMEVDLLAESGNEVCPTNSRRGTGRSLPKAENNIEVLG